MSFFDRKQDVIDIELTTYGRQLLSKGKLNPIYYSFSDQDIIYDNSLNGIEENHNDVHSRITQYPRIQQQSTYTSQNTGSISINENIISSFERHYANEIPIGTTELDDKVPSWVLQFHKGVIGTSYSTLTGSNGYLSIPQINLKDLYISTALKNEKKSINFKNFGEKENDVFGEGILQGQECFEEDFDVIFGDGSVLEILEDEIIFSVEEKNTNNERKNIELELFEEVDGYLVPLSFQKEKRQVVDEILLEKEEEFVYDDLNEQDVETYFDISFSPPPPQQVQTVQSIYNFPQEEIEEC